MTELRYRRILLKLSGEALAGDKGFGYGNFRALFEAIEALQQAR